jgi:uncharacterized protein DUF4404
MYNLPLTKEIPHMDQNPIRRPLEKLHSELANAAAEQPHELLADLQAETEALLARADQAPSADHQSFRERLSQALPEFEASHPALTAIMGEVIDTLSRMGL